MLTVAGPFTWLDKVAFVAAAIVALVLLVGAISALRFRLRRPSEETPEDIRPGEGFVYPRENLLSVLPFLIFNGLIVFLALYVPWPLWIRLIIALPFLLMGGFSCFAVCAFLAHSWRKRRSSRCTPPQS